MRDAAAREQNGTETGAKRPGLRLPFYERVRPPASGARRRLAQLVAAKLTLDLLFIVALAAYTHADIFFTNFGGEIEHADGNGVRGWVADNLEPGAVVEVQLFVDGRFVAAGFADEPRSEGAGSGESGRRGFAFVFDSPLSGEHEARVYAVRAGRGGLRRTLRQVGDPRSFAW